MSSYWVLNGIAAVVLYLRASGAELLPYFSGLALKRSLVTGIPNPPMNFHIGEAVKFLGSLSEAKYGKKNFGLIVCNRLSITAKNRRCHGKK